MPTFWPPSYDAAQACRTLPDCAQLVRRAARYKRQQRMDEYEQCMRMLVEFFVCDDAAPARTPSEVRAAFGLNKRNDGAAEDECVKRNEQRLCKLAPFLDRSKTWNACCAPIDTSQMDALANANKPQ